MSAATRATLTGGRPAADSAAAAAAAERLSLSSALRGARYLALSPVFRGVPVPADHFVAPASVTLLPAP